MKLTTEYMAKALSNSLTAAEEQAKWLAEHYTAKDKDLQESGYGNKAAIVTTTAKELADIQDKIEAINKEIEPLIELLTA
jgi:hypothetical protein